MISDQQIAAELSRIQKSIPPLLIKNAFKKVKLTPTMEMVVDKALESDIISEEKKDKLRYLKEKGEFSKERFIENRAVTKQIDNYVSRQINKSIKEGRLPPRSEIKNLPHVQELKKIYEQGLKDKKD